MTKPDVPYAGAATRAVALAIDVAIAQVIVFAGGAILALVGSLVSDVRLDTLGKLLAAAAWIAVVATYFVLFWSTAGQTPGMRLMGLRVMTPRGEHPGVARSVVRLIGLGLAIVPLFLGFLPVLVDARRRGLHDFLAGTVVLYAERELPPRLNPRRRTPRVRGTAGAPQVDPCRLTLSSIRSRRLSSIRRAHRPAGSRADA
jgi:uncharacterized RDD family membrane protein YckC